jgi:hypothetical protein
LSLTAQTMSGPKRTTSLDPSGLVSYLSPLESPLAPTREPVAPSYFDDAQLAPATLDLTPLRAHYLKRELVSLALRRELAELSAPDALAVLGPPFGPGAAKENARSAKEIDLPLMRCMCWL